MSLFLLALAGAVIPCLLWLWFFYSRDRHDPEPVGLIIRLFLIGALPVAFVAGIVNAVALLVIGTLLVTAFVRRVFTSFSAPSAYAFTRRPDPR